MTLQLPDRLLRDAAHVASAHDVTIGHLVRQLLAKEVARRLHPKTPNRADEVLVAALQALLARDMAAASDWQDLAARLRPHGYELRPAGGGVALHKSSCGTRVCKGSELGFSYRSLVRRFQAAMPDHPRRDLGELLSGPKPDAKPLTSTEKGRLQRALQPVFKSAENWESLIACLHRRQYELRPMGTGLAIYQMPQGRHVCDTATVGYRYRALVKKFGAPMPEHPYGAEWVTHQEPDEPDFDVIEQDWCAFAKENAPTS